MQFWMVAEKFLVAQQLRMQGELSFKSRMLIQEPVEVGNLCGGDRSGGLSDEFAVNKPARPRGEFCANPGVLIEKFGDHRMIPPKGRVIEQAGILPQARLDKWMPVKEYLERRKLPPRERAGVHPGRRLILGESGKRGNPKERHDGAKSGAEVSADVHGAPVRWPRIYPASIAVTLREHYNLAMSARVQPSRDASVGIPRRRWVRPCDRQ